MMGLRDIIVDTYVCVGVYGKMDAVLEEGEDERSMYVCTHLRGMCANEQTNEKSNPHLPSSL